MAGFAMSELSPMTAFIFVFNLVVGVGSLSLPLAFSQAGLFLSSGIIILLACMAYITLSWVIECLSLANFVLRWRNNDLSTPMREHATPLLLQVEANADEQKSMFDITQKVELGEMAHMFMSLRGTSIFYALLCIYLFGDLLIYAVFVPLTLSKACGDFSIWTFHFTEDSSYFFFLLCFAVLVLPFCFMNFSNTKPLQMFCLAMRNVALMAMIAIAMLRAVGDQHTPSAQIKLVDFTQIPAVFGVGIYAFMCHHSLPSIVSPISHKRGLHALFLADYILICIIYLLLCVSAVFAFSPDLPAKCSDADGPPCRIQGPYTLNFASYHIRFLAHFLTLFPVFTLTSNFPLISITLRNNIRALAGSVSPAINAWLSAGDGADALFKNDASTHTQLIEAQYVLTAEGRFWCLVRRHGAAFAAAVPPLVAAIFTQNVNQLVSYTGGFAGLAIQYVVPAWLIMRARAYVASARSGLIAAGSEQAPFVSDVHTKHDAEFWTNPYASPFQHVAWNVLLALWSCTCLGFIIYKFIQ